jgi:hypothetical protein
LGQFLGEVEAARADLEQTLSAPACVLVVAPPDVQRYSAEQRKTNHYLQGFR